MLRKNRLTLILIAAALLIVPLLSACGRQGPITADLTDNKINLSTATASAGDVTFKIKNDSASEVHELVVLRTDMPADKLTLGADGAVDEEKFDSAGEQGDIDADKSADLTLKLSPGHYALICNQPGHYAAGMHLDFTVN
jgi:uncharacterized cupredoxin-like copper-binding protein